MTDMHAERRINDLESQLRKARNDALEEAERIFKSAPDDLWMGFRAYHDIRALKDKSP